MKPVSNVPLGSHLKLLFFVVLINDNKNVKYSKFLSYWNETERLIVECLNGWMFTVLNIPRHTI